MGGTGKSEEGLGKMGVTGKSEEGLGRKGRHREK